MTHLILEQQGGTKATMELLFQIKSVGLPSPVAEYQFDPTRRWRADLAFVRERLIVEIEGGVFSRGRHVRPQGFLNDLEKYNQAVLLGWRLLRVTPQMISRGEAVALLEKALR